jgi:hypothetical protein
VIQVEANKLNDAANRDAIVTLGDETHSVRTTAKQKLKQIDFKFEGRDLRGLEQNPNTKSRWAKMASEVRR